jgi:hypothetical protein
MAKSRVDISQFAATVTPVPEHETYTLMLAGLGLPGIATRRRKQKVAAPAQVPRDDLRWQNCAFAPVQHLRLAARLPNSCAPGATRHPRDGPSSRVDRVPRVQSDRSP